MLAATELGSVLIEAGILPEHCTRAIIDIQVGEPVKVYAECLGDRKLLETPKVVDMLRQAEVIRAWQLPDCPPGPDPFPAAVEQCGVGEAAERYGVPAELLIDGAGI